ncbi:MAG: helix-turn-helix transcriptional regulator [Acidobacterium ailaaui]|nr:helix-turn-helix transcriptional regulator [Pseudacidobacterium ailaaui]
MATTNLKRIREGLNPKVSQEDMARAAGITLATYRKAESGQNVSFTTAQSILKAVNAALEARGKPPVGVFDLGLSIV